MLVFSKNALAAVLFIISGFVIASCDSKSGQLDNGELSANKLIEVPATANATLEEVGPLPVMSFDEAIFDFGQIDPGEVVEHTYAFKNTGEGPLVITNATASCGCTVPSWPKEPIEPNGTGEIKVRFDSKGKSGNQNKTVTIMANTQPSKTILTLKGLVNSPVKEEVNS